MTTSCGFPSSFLHQRMLPGCATVYLFGHLFFAVEGTRLSRRTCQPVTALPQGINIVTFFAFSQLIMAPAYRAALQRGSASEAAAQAAYDTGLCACVLLALLELVGVLCVESLRAASECGRHPHARAPPPLCASLASHLPLLACGQPARRHTAGPSRTRCQQSVGMCASRAAFHSPPPPPPCLTRMPRHRRSPARGDALRHRGRLTHVHRHGVRRPDLRGTGHRDGLHASHASVLWRPGVKMQCEEPRGGSTFVPGLPLPPHTRWAPRAGKKVGWARAPMLPPSDTHERAQVKLPRPCFPRLIPTIVRR